MKDKIKQQDWFDSVFNSVKTNIDFYINELGQTYDQAKENVKNKTCAGPAIWQAIDAEYQP